MRVTRAEVERACYLVDESGAAEFLGQLVRTDPRGRRPVLSARTFLVGGLLAVQYERDLAYDSIHEVLTRNIPVDCQWALGVRYAVRSGDGADEVRVLTIHQVYRFSKTLWAKVNYTPETVPDLDDDERRRREALLTRIEDALIDVTLVATNSTARAIDSTGLWSWARGKRKPTDTDTADGGDGVVEDGSTVVTVHNYNPDSGQAYSRVPVGTLPFDRDAAWGSRTAKDGTRQSFFGYEVDASVRIPDRDVAPGDEPVLVERVGLRPANADVVEPTLALLDRAAAAGYEITEIVADRHYSYKTHDRWARQLRRRGIDQHLDLHPAEQGFRDYNGAKLAAGWLHCPATPDQLGTIAPPGPNASPQAREQFTAQVAQRAAYALRRLERPRAQDGRARWQCPALDGRVGCPLREGSVEAAEDLGLPIVADPPARETAPACCTQTSVSTKVQPDRVHGDSHAKLDQPFYWGSPKWKASYDRRTYVEGFFGNVKNASAENLRRGFVRTTGMGPIRLMLAVAVAACNVRQLRNWHADTGLGDPAHPLLAPDEPNHGFVELTAEQAATHDRAYLEAA